MSDARGHAQDGTDFGRAFLTGMGLDAGFVLADLGFGLWADSLAPTAHLVKPDGRLDDGLLARLATELHERFGIAHATIQWEEGSGFVPLGHEKATPESNGLRAATRS